MDGINSPAQTRPAPRPQSPAPRAPVQAPAPVAQIPPPDPAIVPALRQIESYRSQCAQARAAIGNEWSAVSVERSTASDVDRQPDWRFWLRESGERPKKVSPYGNIAQQTYKACLDGAHARTLRASSPSLTEEESAGQRILQGLGNACARERSAARAEAGSDAKQQANDLVLYKLLEGNDHSRASMRTFSQTNWVGTGKATVAYWQCTAQARLNQMDGGGASVRGGGRESGAHEPDRPGTVIASAPENPYPRQSGDKNYLTEDGKPCITAQAQPVDVHDDGWRNYSIEYTNVCPRIIVIYSRTIQDGPRWNWDGVQSGGIGEGSKSKPAKMTAGCINDPRHKTNACAGYSEWWVK